jgi:surfeit locus 1 family protein
MAADWSFSRKPFWIFSHLFAAGVVVLFIVLGFWQLSRLDERRATNALIADRSEAPALDLTGAPTGVDLDYRAVRAEVRFVEPDLARVANRSQGGVAGEHVVAIVELADGTAMAVNRGFVPVNAEVDLEPVPSESTILSGWLRESVKADGWFAVDDTGEGRILPRFNTEAVAERWGEPLPAYFLQRAPDSTQAEASFPDPVPLPSLDEGPHLAYAVQWFIFATLGVAFYAALLRRFSRRTRTGGDPAQDAHSPAVVG